MLAPEQKTRFLALVMTTPERAKDLKQPAVLVCAASQGIGPDHLVMANYFTANPMETPARFAAQELWRLAGMAPDDIDCAQFYDAFSPLVVISLEEYGFVKPGEGGPFAADGELRVDGGRLPSNTAALMITRLTSPPYPMDISPLTVCSFVLPR